MIVNELIELLGALKKEANNLYYQYKEKQAAITGIQNDLRSELDSLGLRSAKSLNFGVSIVTKPNIQVLHEPSVIEWLNNTPNIESDAYIGLKLTNFKPLALEILKQTGEIIPGTELSQSESLTIRSNERKVNK